MRFRARFVAGKGPEDLKRKLNKLSKVSRKQTVEALQESARFGVAAIQKKIDTTKPHKPVDTGQYRRAWYARNDQDGAVIRNSEKYAIIIEVGRRPGAKMPPFQPILEWVIRKKLAAKKPKKKGKPKQGTGPDPLAGLRNRARQKARGAGGFKPPKRKKRGRRQKKKLDEHAKAILIAKAIQKNIKKKGIRPKKPAERALPLMQRFLGQELDKRISAFQRLTS